MNTGEHIEFENSKLSKWIALGQNIPTTDRRWPDKETSVELMVRIEVERYRDFANKKK